MQQKMIEFSPEKVIPSIEENLREFWGNWGSAPQSELVDEPMMMRLYTGVPYAFCNGVVCARLSPDDVDTKIEAAVDYFCARNATWEWIVGPNSAPATLDKSLEKHGLIGRGQSIGMALNLHDMSRDIPALEEVHIQSVDDAETLGIWANTMIQGFESRELFPTFVNLECSLGFNQPKYRRYLGLKDDQPVSTCSLYLGEQVAGIYCVSTLPTARGSGIGTSITLHALHEAEQMGYHIVVLQSTQMGRKVYQGLGFQEFSILQDYTTEK